MDIKKFKKIKEVSLSIKKRLAISNLLMIVIPVAICAVIGSAGLSLIWNVIVNGTSLGFADSEEFYERASGTAKIVESIIFDNDGKHKNHSEKKLTKFMKSNMMYVSIYDGDKVIYENGNSEVTVPKEISDAASKLENECTIVHGENCLYAHKISRNGKTYQLFLTAKTYEPSYTTMKVCIVILVIILVVTVILSVYFTNRFLIKFIFKKIEKPLEILENGVAQIKEGNLDYRIDYNENTEFLSVCNAFNEMAERLKNSVEQTLKNEQARKELMAGISHDIRSPLTSIQAYVEGLIDGIADTPEKQKKYLLTIKAKSENISNMVSQIFTYSKMELDDYPVELCEKDIKREVEDIVQPIKTEYEQKGLLIKLDIQSEMLNIDSQLLNRICLNIISNSLKYNHNENAEICIYSVVSNDKYSLHFADNGDGVEDDVLEKLFDVFYRSDQSRNDPAKGSGLGLAIVANAVKRMNGTVKAENVKTGGLDIVVEFFRRSHYE